MTRINYPTKAFWLFLILCVQENLSTLTRAEEMGEISQDFGRSHASNPGKLETENPIDSISSSENTGNHAPIRGDFLDRANSDYWGPPYKHPFSGMSGYVKPPDAPKPGGSLSADLGHGGSHSSPNTKPTESISSSENTDASLPTKDDFIERVTSETWDGEHPRDRESKLWSLYTIPEESPKDSPGTASLSKTDRKKPWRRMGEWLAQGQQHHHTQLDILAQKLKDLRPPKTPKSASPNKQSFIKTFYAHFSGFFKGLKKNLTTFFSKVRKSKLIFFTTRHKVTPDPNLIVPKESPEFPKPALRQIKSFPPPGRIPIVTQLDYDHFRGSIKPKLEHDPATDQIRVKIEHLEGHSKEIGGTSTKDHEIPTSKDDTPGENSQAPEKPRLAADSPIRLPETEERPVDGSNPKTQKSSHDANRQEDANDPNHSHQPIDEPVTDSHSPGSRA
ncbi:hypothetical protein CROQUDRAFT_200492 [Cronartium quercuum f. sp. fusiforme G11]|uniref:Uncharacterized protein n=1 Tax=Cronartium quercuum f. sp. fusiforme G11 TaxID=708437 RepID=A0A9P6NFQ7_9BASI|nr:hypothetical protein CROQUDRAFT_200492 [Cronartium quercuum f. sp. fusiforme G11]